MCQKLGLTQRACADPYPHVATIEPPKGPANDCRWLSMNTITQPARGVCSCDGVFTERWSFRHRLDRWFRSVTLLFTSYSTSCAPCVTPPRAPGTSPLTPLDASGLGLSIRYRSSKEGAARPKAAASSWFGK